MNAKYGIPAALVALSLVGFGVVGERYYRVSRPEPIPAVGHVPKQPAAGWFVDRGGVSTPDAGGWRGHLVSGGDVVLTWSSGRQETFTGGGGQPCVLGCLSLYTEALRGAQVAAQHDAGGPPETDPLGDAWLSDLSACAKACDPGRAMSWPARGDGGSR